MRKILLAVDLSNNIYKAAAVNPTLTSEGRFTGGLFGFLHAMAKAIIYTKATQVVLCRDAKPYLRTNTYPDYKSLRATNKDEGLVLKAQETTTHVNELITLLGLPVWSIQGFESDDLIAHAVHKYRGRFSKIVAASNDSDLFQLFRYPNFSVWKGKRGIYERSHFDKEFGVSPDDFVTVLSLTGTHNEVAGIDGCGPVTACRAINNPQFMRQLRTTHAGIIDRNYGLVRLPHPEFPVDAVLPGRTLDANQFAKDRLLLKFCAKFDIDCSQSMLDAFAQIK